MRAIRPITGLSDAHIWEQNFPRHEDPWQVATNYMLNGFLPPFELIRSLRDPPTYTNEHRWVLRGARATARAVKTVGALGVTHIHNLKEEMRKRTSRGPKQLLLPLGAHLGYPEPPPEEEA